MSLQVSPLLVWCSVSSWTRPVQSEVSPFPANRRNVLGPSGSNWRKIWDLLANQASTCGTPLSPVSGDWYLIPEWYADVYVFATSNKKPTTLLMLPFFNKIEIPNKNVVCFLEYNNGGKRPNSAQNMHQEMIEIENSVKEYSTTIPIWTCPLMPMLKFRHCGKVGDAHHVPHISCVKNGLYERITKFDAQKSFLQPQNACRNRRTQLYMNAPLWTHMYWQYQARFPD